MLCGVTNFVNEQLEIDSKIQSQDNKLRELLEYFMGMKFYCMENLKELIHFYDCSNVYENISRTKKN